MGELLLHRKQNQLKSRNNVRNSKAKNIVREVVRIWRQMTDADKIRWDECCAVQFKGAKQKPSSISSGGHEYQIVQDSAWTLRNVAGWTGGIALFACSGPILGAISTLITVAALGNYALY